MWAEGSRTVRCVTDSPSADVDHGPIWVVSVPGRINLMPVRSLKEVEQITPVSNKYRRPNETTKQNKISFFFA